MLELLSGGFTHTEDYQQLRFSGSLGGMWREVGLMMVIILALSSAVVFICWLKTLFPGVSLIALGLMLTNSDLLALAERCRLAEVHSRVVFDQTSGWLNDFRGCFTPSVIDCLLVKRSEGKCEGKKTIFFFLPIASFFFLLPCQIKEGLYICIF